MHKQLVLFTGAVAAIGLFIGALQVNADPTPSWLSSNLSLEKEADTQAAPFSWNGNIDCSPETTSLCSVPTAYGAATSNNTTRLNSSNDYYPVYSYVENRQRFLPIPNSSTAITYTTEPPYGFYLYFNYNFSSAISKKFVSGVGNAYQISHPPDGKLADKSNKRLAAHYDSMSFSSNGQWMVVSSPNVAMLRVNLQTFEVVPFAPDFNYTIGIAPSPKTAITNDGRYVVVASKNFDRFVLYDLDTCAAVPNSINGPINCQSRDLGSFVKKHIPGYQSVDYARFLNNDTLAFYASYKDGSVPKLARFIISSTDISTQIDYLALGDSYISGEGAFNYQSGTDTGDNHCHLSLTSYPYLIGHDLNYNSYHSVACSGAITLDITDPSIPNGSKESQADGKDSSDFNDEIYTSFLPGYRAQINFVTKYRPRAITISIAGNDIGFSDIVQKCALPWNLDNCYESYEDRLELGRLIKTKFPAIVDTYSKIKSQASPNSRIYIIGYPQIAKSGGACALNVRLSSEEAQFSEQIISYLNMVIKSAADKVGVYYVNTEDALNGHRLCEAEPGSVAVNGLTAGTDAPALTHGPIGNESYHPNELGHQLLENKILAATNNLTAPMPLPSLSTGPPLEAGLHILDAPKSGRQIKLARYDPDLTSGLIVREKPAKINLIGNKYGLGPSANLNAELHSDPIGLGSHTTDKFGNLVVQLTMPDTVPAGYHTLHFFGTDINGQQIDIYKGIYLAASEDDYDGDGMDNDSDICLIIEPAGQDYDQDGIDDACDGVVTQPPPPPPLAHEPTPELQEESENPTASAETENPAVVLGSSTDNIQPPAASTEPASQVDLFGSNATTEVISNNKQPASPKLEFKATTQSNDSVVNLRSSALAQHWPLITLLLISGATLSLKLTSNLQTRN